MSEPPVLQADLGPGVRGGFTTRAGGVSRGPWASLNLGLHVGDEVADVVRNRDLLGRWTGAPVRFGHQVHGTRVLAVEGPHDPDDPAGDCDALVTAQPRLPVGVLVADCVPVLLADGGAGVVGAAHAGRAGLLAGVLQRAVERMAALGARPGSVRAVLGPSAGPCCYEVPEQMRADAASVLPALRATTRAGTPSLDLRAGCRSALEAVGVVDVTSVGGCTIEDDDLFSYRRSAVTGRFAGVVVRDGARP